jgi:phage-related holin
MKTTITTTLLYVGTAVLAFFAPIVYAFIFTCILVAVDTITGVMKAGKESVKNISSRKAFAVVPKLIFYFLLVIVAHSCTLVFEQQLPFVQLSLIGIGWIEIKSIDENFSAIFGYSFIDKIMEGAKSVNQIKRHKDENHN